MLNATLLVMVLLAGSHALVPAQTKASAAGSPQIYTGTAEAKNENGAVSGKLVVTLRRLTPEFDRQSVETSLKEGGYPRFLTAIRKAPQVGEVVLAGSKPYRIRYARERVDGGNRVLLLVTEKPIYYLGGAKADEANRAGFWVGVIEIRIDASGTGSGSMAAAARVRPDGAGGVILDDFADELIKLTAITRKSS
jgi:hypothetical protein